MTAAIRLWILVFTTLPTLSLAEGVDWLIAPYGWLPDISLDQSSDSSSGGGGISGSDLLSKTESAGMLRFEVARNRWGLTFDYIWLSLADQSTLSARPPFNVSVDIDGELDLSVIELGAFYRPTGEVAGVNYLVGLRQIGTDKVIIATPNIGTAQVFTSDATVTDVFLGARYVHHIGDRWNFNVRGDYSFGDSEGTLNLLASIGLRVAGPFGLQLGYRHAVIEFEEELNGVPETTEISLSGPYLGFVFRF